MTAPGRPWQSLVFGDWVMSHASVAQKVLDADNGFFRKWPAGRDPELEQYLQALKFVADKRMALGSARGSGPGPFVDDSTTSATNSKRWMASAEVAALLGIREHSVAKACREKRLRARQGDDRRWLVDADDIDRYRASMRTPRRPQ